MVCGLLRNVAVKWHLHVLHVPCCMLHVACSVYGKNGRLLKRSMTKKKENNVEILGITVRAVLSVNLRIYFPQCARFEETSGTCCLAPQDIFTLDSLRLRKLTKFAHSLCSRPDRSTTASGDVTIRSYASHSRCAEITRARW